MSDYAQHLFYIDDLIYSSATRGPTPSNSGSSIKSDPEIPISKPSTDPRCITPEDLQLFNIPDNLHGRKFLLIHDGDDDDDEPHMYEVIGYSRKRDKTIMYDVLFEDRESPMLVDEKEMAGLLEDSLYFDEVPGQLLRPLLRSEIMERSLSEHTHRKLLSAER